MVAISDKQLQCTKRDFFSGADSHPISHLRPRRGVELGTGSLHLGVVV